MAKYKSAMGKVVDMAQLMAKNEHVRAVGNAKMNARGDTIDSAGRIITPVTKRVGKGYQRTVTNKDAVIVREAAKPNVVANVVKDDDLSLDEMQLLDTTAEDTEIEDIKAKNGK